MSACQKILLGVTLLFVQQASALTTIAEYSFADDAFVDQLVTSNGNFLNYNSATVSDVISSDQLRADLTDNSAGTYVLSKSANAYVDLAFSKLNTFNGQGNDLAIFFAGSAIFSVIFYGQARTYNTVNTGYTVSDRFGVYSLTVALIDLTSFGVPSNGVTRTFRVMVNNNSPALSLVGAFNSRAIALDMQLAGIIVAYPLEYIAPSGLATGSMLPLI